MTGPPGNRPTRTDAVLVGVAILGAVGLLAAVMLGLPVAPGERMTGPDGCIAKVWRNAITGRVEPVGRSRLNRDSSPVC